MIPMSSTMLLVLLAVATLGNLAVGSTSHPPLESRDEQQVVDEVLDVHHQELGALQPHEDEVGEVDEVSEQEQGGRQVDGNDQSEIETGNDELESEVSAENTEARIDLNDDGVEDEDQQLPSHQQLVETSNNLIHVSPNLYIPSSPFVIAQRPFQGFNHFQGLTQGGPYYLIPYTQQIQGVSGASVFQPSFTSTPQLVYSQPYYAVNNLRAQRLQQTALGSSGNVGFRSFPSLLTVGQQRPRRTQSIAMLPISGLEKEAGFSSGAKALTMSSVVQFGRQKRNADSQFDNNGISEHKFSTNPPILSFLTALGPSLFSRPSSHPIVTAQPFYYYEHPQYYYSQPNHQPSRYFENYQEPQIGGFVTNYQPGFYGVGRGSENA